MVCDDRGPNQIQVAQHTGMMQVRMCTAVVTMTSFCFEAGKGKQGVCNKSFGAVEHGRWVPTMTEEGLFQGLPCPCLHSLDILHRAGCSWRTAVCKQRLPFRPGQTRVLWFLSTSMQSKMRSLHPWECHLRACRQQSDLRFQNLYLLGFSETPGDLCWLQCLFLFFSTKHYGRRSPPCWLRGPAVSLGQQPLLAQRLLFGFQTILADTAQDLAHSLFYCVFRAAEGTEGLWMPWLKVHPI